MKRRHLIAGLGGIVALCGWLPTARAADRPVVGILSPLSAELAGKPETAMSNMIARLAELGDIDGKTIDLRILYADGDFQRLPKLAAELIAANPAVIYTWTTPGGRAAGGATSAIPIVIAPVGAIPMHAMVADYAHPPGNITGFPATGPAEHGQALRLLQEIVPGLRRVGVLTNPKNPLWKSYPDALTEFARPLGIALVGAPIGGPGDVEPAFAELAAQNIDGLFVGADTSITSGATKSRILDLAVQHKWPIATNDSDLAYDGALLALSPDEPTMARSAADYVHRVLHGTAVADLPVVAPTLLISVNPAAADKLGIAIPPALLARAERVIR